MVEFRVLKMHSKSVDSLESSILGKLMSNRDNFEATRSAIDGDQEGE